jgi:hypothetical protein
MRMMPLFPLRMRRKHAAYRISLTEMLKQEGRTFEAMAEEVMFGDANALALCTEHCEVEPDGTCPHGCPSFMRAAGLI